MASVGITHTPGGAPELPASRLNASPLRSLFVLDPYHQDAIVALRAATDLDVVLPGDVRLSKFRDEANVLLIRSDTPITAEDIHKCQKLEAIVKQGVGTDNIDLQAASQAGIGVYNTPGLNSEAVAELSMTLALALARRVSEIDRRVRAGESIIRSQTLGVSLYGKTLGLIGMGAIALAFARKWIGSAEGQIVGYDPYYREEQWSEFPSGKVRRVEKLDELLEVADVISIHVPLNNTTMNMISGPQLEKMKREVILINAARGGIVNEQALCQALEAGKLFGVGLDAMEVEPPTLKSCGKILDFPNVLITPHIGASTVENQSRSGVATAKVALSLARGEKAGNRVA